MRGKNQLETEGKEVDKLNSKLSKIKYKNTPLGITTNESQNSAIATSEKGTDLSLNLGNMRMSY